MKKKERLATILIALALFTGMVATALTSGSDAPPSRHLVQPPGAD